MFVEEKKMILEHVRTMEHKLAEQTKTTDQMSEQIKSLMTQKASDQAAILKVEKQVQDLVAELQELKEEEEN